MTISPCIKKRYASDKFGIINIRVTNNRKSTYISTQISIPERYWNPKKKEVRSSYLESQSINDKIEEEIRKIKQEINYLPSNKITSNNKRSFLDFLETFLERLMAQQKYGTHKRYKTTKLHLISFISKRSKTDVLFADIDFKWIEDFDDYLKLKDLKQNTRNNYLKSCQKIYKLAIRERVYKTYENPFDFFQFKREKVPKQSLSFGQIQNLVSANIDFGSVTDETRNRFLLQVYGQGLRVSDLYTLRYKNIDFDGGLSRINFIQFKTKKSHSVQLTRYFLKHLFYYFDIEKYKDYYEKRKYKFRWNGKDYMVSLKTIGKQSKKLSLSPKTKAKDTWQMFSIEVHEVYHRIFLEQLELIRQYSIECPNEFIVPCLNEKYFEGVEFGVNTKLTKPQYNHIQSKVAVYNRNLKKIIQYTGTVIKLTSHTARHTYTNLLLNESTDVYSISKSLGHSRLSITEHYLNEFDEEKVDGDVSSVFRRMNLYDMRILKP